ncbi:BrnT family toxin, partial [Candidatus Saccharibacteria bacterium]|nr:BrnT family toxin [Candidatus Saccharibacteria bacterium]
FYDPTHSLDEDRYITIGLVNSLITVIYTERIQALRIISARVATAAERKLYYGTNR